MGARFRVCFKMSRLLLRHPSRNVATAAAAAAVVVVVLVCYCCVITTMIKTKLIFGVGLIRNFDTTRDVP